MLITEMQENHIVQKVTDTTIFNTSTSVTLLFCVLSHGH